MYIYTLHYITLNYITSRYVTLRYVTLHSIALHCMHTYIYMFVFFFFAGRFKEDITHNLYRFVRTYLCAVPRKLHSFFWLGSGTHNVVVERVFVGNQSKTK